MDGCTQQCTLNPHFNSPQLPQILQDLVLADPLRVGPALIPHYHSLLGGATFQRNKDATGGQGDGVCVVRLPCNTDAQVTV